MRLDMAARPDDLKAKLEAAPEWDVVKDLLVEAVRYGDRPDVKARLFEAVEISVDHEAINKLVAERKLSVEGMSATSVAQIPDEMCRAEARRLQPRYVRAFFEAAFKELDGRMARREPGRFEITRVPPTLRERARQIGRGGPVLERHNRVARDKPGLKGPPQAALLASGHPAGRNESLTS